MLERLGILAIETECGRVPEESGCDDLVTRESLMVLLIIGSGRTHRFRLLQCPHHLVKRKHGGGFADVSAGGFGVDLGGAE